MKYLVTIIYKDEIVEEFICTDFPYMGDHWLTLYFPGFERRSIAMERISEIKQKFVEDEPKTYKP